MDDNLIYVFIAFLVTWVVMGVYLWSLGRQVQTLRDEVAALEDPDTASTERAAVVEREQPIARATER